MREGWCTAGVKAKLVARLAGLRIVAALLLAGMVSGCALPPAISIATNIGNGVLLLATGKSSSDHTLSAVTGKDCATWRVMQDRDICHDLVVAVAEPVPASVTADEATPAAASSRNAVAALDAVFQPLAAGERGRGSVELAAMPRSAEPAAVALAAVAPSAVDVPTPARVAAVAPRTGSARMAALPPQQRLVHSASVRADAKAKKTRLAKAKSSKQLALAKGKPRAVTASAAKKRKPIIAGKKRVLTAATGKPPHKAAVSATKSKAPLAAVVAPAVPVTIIPVTIAPAALWSAATIALKPPATAGPGLRLAALAP